MARVIAENCEAGATPTGWNDANGFTWGDTDSLEGTYSATSGQFIDTSWKGFSGLSQFSLFFSYRIVTSSWTVQPVVIVLEDSGGGQQIRFRVNPNQGINILDPDNGFRAGGGNGTIQSDTRFYLWVDGIKGTGSNAVINLYASTTTTKPGSPMVSTTAGEWATDIARLKLQGIGSGDQVTTWDRIILDDVFEALGNDPSLSEGEAYFRAVSDEISLGESISGSAGFSRSVVDAVTIGEAVSRSASFSRSASDGLSLGESVGGSASFARSVADAITIIDTATSSAGFARAVSDAVSLGDSVATAAAFRRVFADAITLGDNVATVADYVRAIEDALTILDSVSTGDAALNIPALKCSIESMRLRGAIASAALRAVIESQRRKGSIETT